MSVRHLTVAWAMAMTLSLGLGCGSCGSHSEPDDDAERAALIAEKIDENPDDAEAILEEHDMSIEEFEKLMYDVAADPKLAERYDKKRKKSE